MKPTTAILPLATLAGLTTALPLTPRSTTFCGQWDSTRPSVHTLYNNLWGSSSGSGSQCTTLLSHSSSSVSWSTHWSWSGGPDNVKSYANLVTNLPKVSLSKIRALPTRWHWSYASSSSIVADVSYDLFTAPSATAPHAYEIMIWLAALGGAGPISSTGQPVGTLEVSGTEFKLFKGPNGDTTVYSFVAAEPVGEFGGDLMDFFRFLVEKEGMSGSQVLVSAGAGTEPFTGQEATLTVSEYSLSLEE